MPLPPDDAMPVRPGAFRSTRISVATALLAMGLSATPVLADRIDGDWCLGQQSLSIEGANLRTPGGRNISGEYDRHAFRYLAPSGETDAGQEVLMRQLNDETMRLWRRPAGSTESPKDGETWTRCQPIS